MSEENKHWHSAFFYGRRVFELAQEATPSQNPYKNLTKANAEYWAKHIPELKEALSLYEKNLALATQSLSEDEVQGS